MTAAQNRVFDVVIAGGGYAGLALALALTRSLGPGIAVAIVERKAMDGATTADPRAFAVSAGSRRLLGAVGVWGGLAADAEPVLRIEITDSALEDSLRPVLLAYDNVVDGDPQTHIVEASRLQRALAAAATAEPAITIIDRCEVEAMEVASSVVRLALRGAGSVEAHLAVAADGAESRLRQLAGIGVNRSRYGQTGIVALVGLEEDHRGVATQHFLPSGPFAILPLPGRRACVTWSEGEARAREILALDDESFVAELQRRAGWRLGALSLLGARAAWPLEARVASAMTASRLALVGDAARSVHPIAGQGVNLGLRDVAALAESLADGLRLGLEAGDATVLDRYQRWRRFDGFQSTLTYSALNALFSSDILPLRGLRDAGLGVVDRMPGLKQWLVAEAAGMTGDVPRLLKGEMP